MQRPRRGHRRTGRRRNRPAHRGRGIAGAVTAELARVLLHERGAASVWLEYGGHDSRRVYERVGFRPRGTRRYARLED